MNNNGKKRLLILSCSARKSDAPVCHAVERYQSPAFYLVRRFLKLNPNHNLVIWILSAKYGLMGAERKIEHYDLALTPTRAAGLKGKLPGQFQVLYKYGFGSRPPAEVFCHLPQIYRETIDEYLALIRKNSPVEIAEGAPGVRLRQLKDWLNK